MDFDNLLVLYRLALVVCAYYLSEQFRAVVGGSLRAGWNLVRSINPKSEVDDISYVPGETLRVLSLSVSGNQPGTVLITHTTLSSEICSFTLLTIILNSEKRIEKGYLSHKRCRSQLNYYSTIETMDL